MGDAGEQQCRICRRLLHGVEPVAMIEACHHTFHEQCIRNYLIHTRPQCILCDCRVPRTPPCTSPSATMTIRYGTEPIFGNTPTFFITMEYHVPIGTQQAYHESPGMPYSSTTRLAYLPDDQEGRLLLQRLKHAFTQGLTFNIGTSMTTGAHHVVVWTSLWKHKTSVSHFGNSGPQVLPDSSYCASLNAQLDWLGIPRWAPTDPIDHHDQTISYTAPTFVRPPTLPPFVLRPVPVATATAIGSSAASLSSGRSPSGTMTIQFAGHLICPGFHPITTCIVITYQIPAGTRRQTTTAPFGSSFGSSTNIIMYPGTVRTAYLPNNEEGRCLLMRLIRAFSEGRTFDIGTSMTFGGQNNVVVWTSQFNHKTSLEGGPHGFPDVGYMATCNAQLDAIGIPRLGPPGDLAQLHNKVIPYTAPPV